MSVRDVVAKRKPKVAQLELSDGDVVWIRSLDGAGRGRFRDMVKDSEPNGGMKAEVVVAMALCEEDGTLVYDHKSEADLAEIRGMEGADVDFIFMKFLDLAKLNAESVEALRKN